MKTVALLCTLPAALASQPRDVVSYRDPKLGFEFEYPARFGQAARGTNDGVGGRAAAIRFSDFSDQGVGGEAVLTTGPPTLDLQAAGGLYDEIAREAIPEPLRTAIVQNLPRLSSDNLCDQISRESHVDLAAPFLSAVPPSQREAIHRLDRLGNLRPTLLYCVRTDDTVVFQKSAAFAKGYPPRLVSGAVRFLAGKYSSFQLVRAGPAADASRLAEMRDLVTSWRAANR